ncbi:DUF5597 domain-containing protein [Bacteroidota bacterium]
MKKKSFRLSGIPVLILAGLTLLLMGSCARDPGTQSGEHNIPHLKETNGVIQLYVEDEPFIVLGGELRNSSSSNLEFMKPIWGRMRDLNVNTMILPVAWQQFEPVEGEFDYSLVDGLIQDARKYDRRLVILWFGAWKNGMSGYNPAWVSSDIERFPRMKYENGEKIEVLSNLSENLLEAEQKAFFLFMERIAEIDSEENTVIMVQVENEVGIRGSTRDFSDLANEKFEADVPSELMDYLEENRDILQPVVGEAWKSNGYKTSGTWEEIFGKGMLADEIFMAWSYSTYINAVAEAGKKAYDLPMFANTWLHTEGRVAGIYPSGGPVATMLDIWDAGAPDIAFLAPDIYEAEFKFKCEQFLHNGNPLFIPEACAIWYDDTVSGPAKAYYSIANHNAIGFSPFGIDDRVYHPNHPIKKAYGILESMMPMIVKAQQEDRIQGFMEEGNAFDSVYFGDYKFLVDYSYQKPDYMEGYGFILQVSEDEFIISGNGMTIQVSSEDPGKPDLSFLLIEEGEFIDGIWHQTRVLSGDETLNNGTDGIKFPPNPYDIGRIGLNDISVQKIKVFLH